MKIKEFLVIFVGFIGLSQSGGPGDHDCDPFISDLATIIDIYIGNITTATESAIDELLTLNSSFYELPSKDFDIRVTEIETLCLDNLLNSTSIVLNHAEVLTNSKDTDILDIFMKDTTTASYPLSCLIELITSVHDMLYDSMDEISFAAKEIKREHQVP
ncbi:unnamed protein product [Chironomus riparius]|uniref:Pectinesterase inhibitor domain-containing protein n=1 Tax=Chironomus riparius TaxID=315576 RepID=A0A9N9S4D3_9DIPT|nr:unnamed protein product [Chironomus riparius]